MKKITNDLFSSIFDESIIEYTKSRFLAEEEYEELKNIFLSVTNEKLVDETFDNARATLTFNV